MSMDVKCNAGDCPKCGCQRAIVLEIRPRRFTVGDGAEKTYTMRPYALVVCDACGARWRQFVTGIVSRWPDVVCPQCGANGRSANGRKACEVRRTAEGGAVRYCRCRECEARFSVRRAGFLFRR